MSIIALYYVCSVEIYYNVYCIKKQQKHTKQSKGRNCKTYRK